MERIQWSEKYEVGVKEIDRQHQGLFETIDILFNAIRKGDSKEVLGNTLKKLLDYAGYHFDTEEKYMKQYDFPGYNEHKKAHDEFRGKVQDFQKAFEADSKTLSIEVISFLLFWLDSHILFVDKQLFPFLKSKGVS